MSHPAKNLNLSENDLYNIFIMRHNDLDKGGWSPKRRRKFNYYLPSEYYEAILNQLILKDTCWLDVGGGDSLFPDNKKLSILLSERASLIVGVDPSENIMENPYVHERAKCKIETFSSHCKFHVATFRMVAEHINHPTNVIRKLNQLLQTGGKVVVFTVNLWSPLTIISRLLPFKYHYPIKKLFWGGEEKDTFPTCYKMNTRKSLKKLFISNGFKEDLFMYLDDCVMFSKSKFLNLQELYLWRFFKKIGKPYPENCILSVYTKHQDI